MKLGLVTPVVTLNPRVHNEWEETAGFDAVVRIAEEADLLGYHHLTCSEHVAVPEAVAPVRGARYYDPLAVFGYLAATTQRIRFATHVLVLGYHHPLALAKRYGTLDVVSGGRLVLGVGVGSLREEFELLGASFNDRGDRGDDALRALRAAMSVPMPSFEGAFHSFSGMVVDPCAVQPHVPIWIGGRTPRSLRRALELGDGWAPFGLDAAALAETLGRARDSAAWDARAQPFDLVLYPEPAPDPLAQPQQFIELIATYAEIGATIVNLRLVHSSREHCLEQLAAAATLAATVGVA